MLALQMHVHRARDPDTIRPMAEVREEQRLKELEEGAAEEEVEEEGEKAEEEAEEQEIFVISKKKRAAGAGVVAAAKKAKTGAKTAGGKKAPVAAAAAAAAGAGAGVGGKEGAALVGAKVGLYNSRTPRLNSNLTHSLKVPGFINDWWTYQPRNRFQAFAFTSKCNLCRLRRGGERVRRGDVRWRRQEVRCQAAVVQGCVRRRRRGGDRPRRAQDSAAVMTVWELCKTRVSWL
jgi:hypothetical protein